MGVHEGLTAGGLGIKGLAVPAGTVRMERIQPKEEKNNFGERQRRVLKASTLVAWGVVFGVQTMEKPGSTKSQFAFSFFLYSCQDKYARASRVIGGG